MEPAGESSEDEGPEVVPRRGGRRRRVVVGALLAVGGLVAAGLLVPTPVVDGVAVRSVARWGGDCADLIGVDVHSGRWPVVGRLLAGRYEQVSADIDEVRLRDTGLSYHDVRVTAARIDIGSLGGLLGDDVRIHDGTATATLRFDAMESLLTAYGVTAELSEEAGAVRAEVLVPPFGEVPTTVHVVAAEGEVELQFVPLDLVVLPPMRIALPAPAAVRALDVGDDGVQVDATIDGVLRPEELACEV